MLVRFFITLFTVITFVAVVFFAVWGFVKLVPILSVSCLALAAVLALFLYNDLRYWISSFKTKK